MQSVSQEEEAHIRYWATWRVTESSNYTSSREWREGWVGSFVHTRLRDVFSEYYSLLSLLAFFIYSLLPSPLSSILALPLFFRHSVTMGDALTDRVSLCILSLASRIWQVHIIQLGTSVQESKQVTLPWAPTVSLTCHFSDGTSFLHPMCSWHIIFWDSPHRRDFQVSVYTDWIRRTKQTWLTSDIQLPVQNGSHAHTFQIFLTLPCAKS